MSLKTHYSNLLAILPFGHFSVWLLGVNLVIAILVLLLKGLLPPVVPLFYGKPYGADQLAGAPSLMLPPLAALGLSVINIMIAVFTEDEFLKKVIFGSMVVVTMLSLITVLKIFILVGNI